MPGIWYCSSKPLVHSMDFELEDSITYRTFERAFDTHLEECSSGTVCTVEEFPSDAVCAAALENDADAKQMSDARSASEILIICDIEEEVEEVEVEVEAEVDEKKTDEEREEERMNEERKKIVAESMILYKAQLKAQKETEEEILGVKIRAKTEDKEDEKIKVK